MDEAIVIEVEGLDTLAAALNTAADRAVPLAAEAIDNALRAIYAEVEPYPPETIANSPQNPQGRWYERHYGPRWLRKRALAGTDLDVSILTTRKRVNIFEGAGLVGGRNTSEQLQLRWKLNEAAQSGGAIEGSLENNASYAVPVQGPRDLQASNMSEIGWKSIDDAIAATGEVVDQILKQLLDDLITLINEG